MMKHCTIGGGRATLLQIICSCGLRQGYTMEAEMSRMGEVLEEWTSKHGKEVLAPHRFPMTGYSQL